MTMIDNKVLRNLEADLEKRKKKICEKMGKKYVDPKSKKKKKTPAKSKAKKRKVDSEDDTEDEDEVYTPAKKKKKFYGIDAEGNPMPPPGKDGNKPGVCPICGKTIGRMNELAKHQQSAACKKVALEKGIFPKEDADEDSILEDVKSGKFKSSMKKRYDDEEKDDKFDPGELDGDFDDGSAENGHGEDEDADDAIQQAVKASLETARQDLGTDGSNDNNMGERSPDAYIDPTPQPDVVANTASLQTPKPATNDWQDGQCAMQEPVVTTAQQHIARPWGLNGQPDPMNNVNTQEQVNAAHAAASIANAIANGAAPAVWNHFNQQFYQQ